MQSIVRFFKDKKGRVVIVQSPNLPIIGWVVLRVMSEFIAGNAKQIIGGAASGLLLIWAILEIVKGDSGFRKLLGATVFVVLLCSYIAR